MFKRRPTPATVISCIALFVALGGTTYAAATIGSSQIKNNSIKSTDIKNNNIRSKDIRTGNVRSSDVKNGTLRARDFNAADLPKGPQGPKGDKGDKGDNNFAAYLRINAGGGVDETRTSPGITDAQIEHPTAGFYCIKGLPFTPKHVQATVDYLGGGTNSVVHANAGGEIATCTGEQVMVRIVDGSSSTAEDHDHYVVLFK